MKTTTNLQLLKHVQLLFSEEQVETLLRKSIKDEDETLEIALSCHELGIDFETLIEYLTEGIDSQWYPTKTLQELAIQYLHEGYKDGYITFEELLQKADLKEALQDLEDSGYRKTLWGVFRPL